MNSFDTKIYNVENPAGFDLEIAHMQGVLSKLTFIDTIYGRAHIQEQPRGEEEIESLKRSQPALKGQDLLVRRYPQGRKFDQDIDLTFDDRYPSMMYFYTEDPASSSTREWTQYQPQVFGKQPFSLMFFCSLTKLDCASGEQLKIAILKQLSTMNNLKVGEWYEGYKNVLRDFTITDTLRNVCRYPYYALRIEGESSVPYFQEGCGCTNMFDENTLIDLSREAITDDPGITNVN